ncbi:hypothetical protein EB796_002771 [Bugula neritina]|nr:hypothetical protein EB796_002771 [Bugula neritina]
MAASKPPVPVTSAKTGLDPALSTAELQPTHVVTLESDRPSKDISHAHGLHRQGALYQHEHHGQHAHRQHRCRHHYYPIKEESDKSRDGET